ncbi:hypothetical protein ABG79_01947 [Caloramator mitchellensis]|uniref:Uncharacterized protein n=1 Tax=Caloramator mitchellensis TaxID=908809 RepID=A0A0R3JRX7_CALMK|nr:hypothetical protein [Caloramator mitchellensis]KRQ86217.1 hypothetical protein ABG79_01947 [Caloramator mitchellensis]
MPKNKTLEIQEFLIELGEKLGLVAKKEVCLIKSSFYSPIFDVVWFLDLSKYYDFSSITDIIKNNLYFDYLHLLPIAVFEIEGSSSSSKNQIGNMANLILSNSFLKFIVVNNEEAIPEKDTYRRAIKIKRYFEDFSGDSNVILLDWSQLKRSDKHLDSNKLMINYNRITDDNYIRKGSGGETASIDIGYKILKLLYKTGLEIKQDYTPTRCIIKDCLDSYFGNKYNCDDMEFNFYLKKVGIKDPKEKVLYELKNIKNRRYLPKIDIVAGFNLPISVIEWLKNIAINLEYDIINNPLLFYIKQFDDENIFVPLISVEIETSVSKHLNGGLFNLWKNSYLGILVSTRESQAHLEFFRLNGCNNVSFLDCERVLGL